MPKIIRRDFLKVTAAAAAQSAIWKVAPSWAGARRFDGVTYYPTILGSGGHNNSDQNYSGHCYGNVGLGRCAMQSPSVTDQSQTTQIIRVPGTVSNLSWGLDYNSGSGTFESLTFSFNVNDSPSSLMVSFGSVSGWMTDDTDIVSVSVGNKLSFDAYCGTDGCTGFDGDFYCASAQFLADGTGLPPIQSAQMVATVGSSELVPNPDTQKFASFIGILGDKLGGDLDSTEGDVQFDCLTAGRWRNLACNIPSNAFGYNTIVTNRIQIGTGSPGNGSMSLNIPANTTGYFEDETYSDDVSAGDLLDYGFLAGTVGSPAGGVDYLTIDWVGSHFIASSAAYCMIGGTPQQPIEDPNLDPGQTNYSPLFGGGATVSDEGRSTGMFPYAALVSEFSNKIVSWGGSLEYSVTFGLIRNGDNTAPVLSTTITTDETGWVTASGSYQFDAGDTCANQLSIPANTGTTRYNYISWGGAGLLVQAN